MFQVLDARPGDVLGGRYRLQEALGRGGMADVLRARDTVLDRDVAIKVFHRPASMPEADGRRSAEVRLLASLNHPGLVALFDAGRDRSDPSNPFGYLVMELVEGSTLADLVTTGPLLLGQAARIGAQLAAALAYVHSRGVVHRDVKPANVLVAGDGADVVAKLTDFGVARLLDTSRLTTNGATIGTANYLSPEQAMGQPVGTASDVYSLGLLVLECLTGAVAFPGLGVEAAIARLYRAPDVPTALSAEWRRLLAAMTAFDPGARPTAAQAAASLAALSQAGDQDESVHGGVTEAADDPPTELVSVVPGFDGFSGPPASDGARSESGAADHGRGVLPWLVLAAAAAVTVFVVMVLVPGRGDPTSTALAATGLSSSGSSSSRSPAAPHAALPSPHRSIATHKGVSAGGRAPASRVPASHKPVASVARPVVQPIAAHRGSGVAGTRRRHHHNRAPHHRHHHTRHRHHDRRRHEGGHHHQHRDRD